MRALEPKQHLVIYKKNGTYNGFPNLARLRDGRILAAFRQAKDRRAEYGTHTHTDVTGKAVYVCSADGGRTWDAEATGLYDFPLGGMNDTNVATLSDGTVLAVFYRWRSFLIEDAGRVYPWDTVQEVHGRKFVWRLDGTYTLRSSDSGATWDQPIKIVFSDSPMEIHSRGRALELPDGSLLLPVNGSIPFYRSNSVFSMIVRSTDRGKTWQHYSTAARSETVHYYETTIYRSESGAFTAFHRGILRDSKTDAGLYTSFSQDGGKTWSEPSKPPYPTSSTVFDVIRLPDDRALLTYGYRLEPYGVRARILEPDCRDVDSSEEIVLRDDGLGTDIGYSSSIVVSEGEVLVAYYYYGEDGNRYIGGTMCSYETKGG